MNKYIKIICITLFFICFYNLHYSFSEDIVDVSSNSNYEICTEEFDKKKVSKEVFLLKSIYRNLSNYKPCSKNFILPNDIDKEVDKTYSFGFFLKYISILFLGHDFGLLNLSGLNFFYYSFFNGIVVKINDFINPFFLWEVNPTNPEFAYHYVFGNRFIIKRDNKYNLHSIYLSAQYSDFFVKNASSKGFGFGCGYIYTINRCIEFKIGFTYIRFKKNFTLPKYKDKNNIFLLSFGFNFIL